MKTQNAGDADDGRELEETTLLSEGKGEEDPRLLAAVREYMTALDAGLRPSRREWLERYPEIGKELAACLDGLAFVHSAAAKMHASGEGGLDVSEEVLAQPLGDFRLVKEIGRGGMGVVYEAIQLSLGRKVAVKVLPFTAALDPRHLERFRNEASAAAHLHHTNIVPVYAVGCERSVHYYAMQLIDGQSLLQVIGELRNIAAVGAAAIAPRREDSTQGSGGSRVKGEESRGSGLGSSVPWRSETTAVTLSSQRTMSPAAFYQSVARLGQQAAEALEYAHEAGVVHRDIKPANLMVDGRGKLWITDFGLAQFYADAELTQTGDLVGTIAYMSPEQASGKAVVLDQRTDIYSLGITLYELVTLQRAFPAKNREELLKQVSLEDPRSPRLIDKRIPRELETIVEKATAKEPGERYQTALALSEDLARFLRDEPIHARPPSRWEKTVKWTRRHKSVAVSALIVLFFAAAGLLTSTILIAREEARTQASFQQARTAVDGFAQVAEEEMTEPRLAGVRRTLLEQAYTYYAQVLKDHEDEASTRTEIMAAQRQVHAILNELEASQSAERASRRMDLIRQPSVQEDLVLSSGQIADAKALDANALDSNGRYSSWIGPGRFGFLTARAGSSEERRAEYKQYADSSEASLHKLLSVSQYERLAQIEWQAAGPRAFKDDEVVKALGLTEKQRAGVTRVMEKIQPMWGPHGPGGGPDQEQGQGQGQGQGGMKPGGMGGEEGDFPGPGPREAEMEALTEEIKGMLTGEQLKAWEGLIGAKFVGDVRPFGMGRGRGGPGGM